MGILSRTRRAKSLAMYLTSTGAVNLGSPTGRVGWRKLPSLAEWIIQNLGKEKLCAA